MSLHNRLTLFIMLCLTAALGLASWLVYELNRERVYEHQKEKVEFLAEILGNGLKSLMLEGRGRDFQRFLQTLVAEDIEAIRIFTNNGTILNSSVPGETGRKVSDNHMALYRSSHGAAISVERRKGREIYSRIVSITNDLLCQKCHGDKEQIRGILDVEISSRDADQKIAEGTRRILLGAALVLVLCFVAVRTLVVRLVRDPIDGMLEKMRRWNDGDTPPSYRLQRDGMALLREGIAAMHTELQKSQHALLQCTMEENHHVERMASIGELAAAVAHEIKNPLAGISGALQVLAEDFPADSPRKEIAGEVLKEIVRLDAAVKDLLFFARPPELNLIPAEVNAIIEKVHYRLAPEAALQNVKMTVSAQATEAILLDPEQMEKALANIITHCIQTAGAGGELALAVMPAGEEGLVEITVSVTGAEISEERLGDAFKPFFSTKQPGTGLGLAISRSIIENHKGTIGVVRREGGGSTFRILMGKG